MKFHEFVHATEYIIGYFHNSNVVIINNNITVNELYIYENNIYYYHIYIR